MCVSKQHMQSRSHSSSLEPALYILMHLLLLYQLISYMCTCIQYKNYTHALIKRWSAMCTLWLFFLLYLLNSDSRSPVFILIQNGQTNSTRRINIRMKDRRVKFTFRNVKKCYSTNMVHYLCKLNLHLGGEVG